jgi:hypothetical protein
MQRWQVTDSRSCRLLLDPEIFLNGSNPPPTDLIDLELWDHLVHLADHVSITTSNHHGALLTRLYELDRSWVDIIGDQHDWISEAMIDVMDEFHASIFLLLHGFYRQSIAGLRSVLESTLVGTSLHLSRDEAAFRLWRLGGEFGFGQAADKMFGHPEIRKLAVKLRTMTQDDLFSPRGPNAADGWSRRLYGRLCEFSHSRPGSTNVDLWRSNGPIYVRKNVSRTATLYTETYTLAVLLVRLARSGRSLPSGTQRGFERSRAPWARLARECHPLL